MASTKHTHDQSIGFALVSFLTLLRILVIPVLGILLYQDTFATRISALVVIIVAAITDWLDGFLARRWHISSSLGRFMDPIADKIMVVGTFILAVMWQDTSLLTEICVLIIILREIIISGLREYLALENVVVRVSLMSKNKTATQFVALVILVGQPIAPVIQLGHPFQTTDIYSMVVLVCLSLAALLSAWTAIEYIRNSFHHLVLYESDKG